LKSECLLICSFNSLFVSFPEPNDGVSCSTARVFLRHNKSNHRQYTVGITKIKISVKTELSTKLLILVSENTCWSGLADLKNLRNLSMYVYIGFKTFLYVVRHLDSIASYLPTGLHLDFFRSWPSLFISYSFSSVFLVLSFVLASTSMLFCAIFLLSYFEHGRTM
jgi:hypothetical protein